MKWTIGQLQKFRDKELRIDEFVDISDIKERDSQIRGVSPIKVTGRVDIHSSDITFHLHLSGTLILPCSRTLVDVKYPIDIDTTETFILKAELAEYAMDEATAIIGDVVDLIPVIKENLLLEIPMQVFCEDVNVEGAAPQSGEHWSVLNEEEQKQKVDPRLAKLANYFDNNKES
ncbi:YceD family protein [Peribacillus loiseleuriae]|uniref:YceD family protein n=1 Tax=Peribacillus loiseleuriae TaxID=1679170 RepID=UPI003D089DF3